MPATPSDPSVLAELSARKKMEEPVRQVRAAFDVKKQAGRPELRRTNKRFGKNLPEAATAAAVTVSLCARAFKNPRRPIDPAAMLAKVSRLHELTAARAVARQLLTDFDDEIVTLTADLSDDTGFVLDTVQATQANPAADPAELAELTDAGSGLLQISTQRSETRAAARAETMAMHSELSDRDTTISQLKERLGQVTGAPVEAEAEPLAARKTRRRPRTR